MPLSVSIEPLTPSIDMYDSPDTNSAYSLSGHIAITLTPSSSLLGLARPSPQNLLLTSLELTFEGQSELVLTDVGYTPLRLISLSKELVAPSQPVHISTAPDDDHAEWRVVFDLAVPGWLPATDVFGDNDGDGAAGVSYALYARARFLSIPPDPDDAASAAPSTSAPSVWNNLCSVVGFGTARSRAVHADKVPIHVARFVSPPPHGPVDAPPAFAPLVYAIQAVPKVEPDGAPTTHIPADVLRAIELHTAVPSRTPVANASVPLVMRLRARCPEHTRARLRVLAFDADVVQREEFHTSPAARHPLPPAGEQPPACRLRAPHHVHALCELGLVPCASPGRRVVRERSLVPAGTAHAFTARGNDADADADAGAPGAPFEDGWLRIQVDVPVSPGLEDGAPAAVDNSPPRPRGKRVAGDSPFLAVRHEMRVRLSVGYAPPGEALLSDDLAFVVPLEFVRPAPPPPALAPAQHTTAALPRAHPPMCAARVPSPAPPPLPAYSQLFHANGEGKDEWRGALPLYREKDDAPPPALLAAAALRDKHGESFLCLDDDAEDTDMGGEVGGPGPGEPGELEPGELDVQYGIAL